MNKRLLVEMLRDRVDGQVDSGMRGWLRRQAEVPPAEQLFELNRRRPIDLPSRMPASARSLLTTLRRHFKDDVTKISLVMNHHFPDDFIFYRASSVEPEIFEGLEFFSEVCPELNLRFTKVGRTGVKRCLELNSALLKLHRRLWPKKKGRDHRIQLFLYQGSPPVRKVDGDDLI